MSPNPLTIEFHDVRAHVGVDRHLRFELAITLAVRAYTVLFGRWSPVHGAPPAPRCHKSYSREVEGGAPFLRVAITGVAAREHLPNKIATCLAQCGHTPTEWVRELGPWNLKRHTL
jgi:hypothetical protein